MNHVHIYFKTLIAFLLIGITSSCTYDETIFGSDKNTNVKLTLALGEQAFNVSRAQVEGVGTENTVSTVELFFYKQTGGTADAPVFSEQPTFRPSAVTVGTDGTVSFSMLVAELEELCPSDKVCQVYAIVNRGTNALPVADANGNVDYSIASLKQMVLEAAFIDDDNNPQAQTTFVMAGEATNISRTTDATTGADALTGNIPVERVAVKIGLQLVDANNQPTDALQVTDANGTPLWTATSSAVKISLRRGSLRTYLGSTPTEYIYPAQSADIFNAEYISLASLYTYPTNWSNNEKARTHLMLEVIWTNADEKAPDTEQFKTTYYEINVNPAGSYLQRNYYYQIRQEISVLGSEAEDTPLQLNNASYKVLSWNTTDGSSGSLTRPRYLMVEETAITLQNVPTKRIYFNSSDPIDLINNNLTIKWDNTKPETAVELTMATFTNAAKSVLDNGDIQYVISNTTAVSSVANRIQGDYKVTITIHNANKNDATDRSYIEVTHPLKNLMDASSDYSRYFIDFGVQHQDNATYKETIKITQYPMLSIVADQNSSGPKETNGGDGYVFINGSNTSYTDWERVAGGLTNNTCPNRYIVSVSTLNNTDAGKKYIIGDPRTDDREITVDNRDLSNYLPADVNVNPKMISPEFMFASSYGQCPAFINKEKAERRCATYQEDGYPAGRWRLPTEAEVKYAIQLYNWEVIPQLFSENVNYWSANGKINGNGVNNGNSYYNGEQVAVRCVYDTWYWGTEHIAKSTTWTYDDTRD